MYRNDENKYNCSSIIMSMYPSILCSVFNISILYCNTPNKINGSLRYLTDYGARQKDVFTENNKKCRYTDKTGY